MATEVSGDPVELGRAALTAQENAERLAENVAGDRARLALFEGVFGLNGSAHTAFVEYRAQYEAAMVTMERLVVVLEQESDALFQTGFALLAADQTSAEGIAGVSPVSGHPPA